MWGGDEYASISARFKQCATHPPSVWNKDGVVQLTCLEVNEVNGVSVKRSTGFHVEGMKNLQLLCGAKANHKQTASDASV